MQNNTILRHVKTYTVYVSGYLRMVNGKGTHKDFVLA